MTKKKIAKFDVTKAVKANARERIGQPRPEKVIEKSSREERREEKHKATLGKLLKEEP
jgi:hypothetical protein